MLPSKFQPKGNIYPCFNGVFNDVLIVVTYNSPFYGNIDIINSLYENVFGKVVHCGVKANHGRKPDIIADVGNGHRGYVCMARAIEKYPDFQGIVHFSYCLNVQTNVYFMRLYLEFVSEGLSALFNPLILRCSTNKKKGQVLSHFT